MPSYNPSQIADPHDAGKLAAALLGYVNRARLGFPARIFFGAGGVGDSLLCSTAFRELKKRGRARLGMLTTHPALFERNPDVDFVITPDVPKVQSVLHCGLPITHLVYSDHDPGTDSDTPLDENVLAKICRVAGVKGAIELRPWLFLTMEERRAGKLAERQIAIQSSALGALYPSKNKEWYPDRFQWVADKLAPHGSLVQIGSASDPPISGAHDLRGKTTLRQSAAILANSILFIGLETFAMHLARAVDCRSVIVYGGRLLPSQIGYIANANLTGPTPCSPCWLRNTCDFNHECMNMISAKSALEAAEKQIARHGTPLEVETAIL